MCLCRAILTSGNMLNVIKRLDPTFQKNFDAKKAANARKAANKDVSVKSTSAIKKTLPKQKRRLRSFSELGYNPGRRSFLEGGQ